MNYLLSIIMIYAVFVLAHDKRVEVICWRVLFISLSVHVSLFYLFTYEHYVGRQNVGIAVTLTDILSIGLLLRYALRRRRTNQCEFHAVRKYTLYFGFACLSLFYSFSRGMTINELGTQVELLCLMALLLFYMKKEYFKLYTEALLLNSYTEAILCLYQAKTGVNFRGSDALVLRYGVYRCQGLYITPAELALISIVTFFVFLILLMNKETLIKRKWLKIGIVSSVFCVIAAQSRVGFVIMALGLIFLAIIRSNSIKTNSKALLRISVIVGIVAVGIMFVLGEIDFGNSADMALSRFKMWEMGMKVFQTSPLLGVGINSYTAFNIDFSTSSLFWEKSNPVHNIYIMELAETGLIGFIILYANYYVSLLTYCYRRMKRNYYLEILFIVLVVQLIYGFTGWVFYSPSLRFYNVALFMILLVMGSKNCSDA